MRLLVVDWDTFFPVVEPPDTLWDLYDWGHNENWGSGLQSMVWLDRAANFVRSQVPLPGLSGLQETFWQRFTFTANATLFVSESNFASMMPAVRRGIKEVALFDAHHDGGYKERLGEHWNCENWAVWYGLKGIPVHVYYPTWRTHVFETEDSCLAETLGLPFHRQFDHGHPDPHSFDRIHVCRSGSWVPPWLDGAFQAFLEACPAYCTLRTIGDVQPRTFDMQTVQEIVVMWQAVEA